MGIMIMMFMAVTMVIEVMIIIAVMLIIKVRSWTMMMNKIMN